MKRKEIQGTISSAQRVVSSWNLLPKEAGVSNTMAGFEKLLGNFMTINHLCSCATEVETLKSSAFPIYLFLNTELPSWRLTSFPPPFPYMYIPIHTTYISYSYASLIHATSFRGSLSDWNVCEDSLPSQMAFQSSEVSQSFRNNIYFMNSFFYLLSLRLVCF